MKKILAGLATGLFIIGMAGMACATPVEWEITFDTSVVNVGGNVYVFSVDTEKRATQTYEPTSSVSTPFSPSLFYVEYVSKNGVEKGFNYLTYGAGDTYYIDYNLGVDYVAQKSVHFELFEDYSNRFFLNLYFGSDGYGSDYSLASGVSIRDVDTGINYATNVLKSGFTIERMNPVPEPATILLFGIGLAGLAGSRFRRKKEA